MSSVTLVSPLQMLNFHVLPLVLEIFRDKAAVTVLRLVFTAKETASVEFRLVNILDFSPCH